MYVRRCPRVPTMRFIAREDNDVEKGARSGVTGSPSGSDESPTVTGFQRRMAAIWLITKVWESGNQ